MAVDRDKDFAVFPLYFGNVAVELSTVLQLGIQAFPNVLGAFLPGPEINIDEIHCRLEVKILQNICRRDLIKVSITK